MFIIYLYLLLVYYLFIIYNLFIIYLFIYLFRLFRLYVDVIHPLHLLSPSIFVFQVLDTKHCISANGARQFLLVDHRVCSKEGEIIISDINVLQDNHVQIVEASLQRHAAWPVRCIATESARGRVGDNVIPDFKRTTGRCCSYIWTKHCDRNCVCIRSYIVTVSNQLFVLPSEGVLAPKLAEQNETK